MQIPPPSVRNALLAAAAATAVLVPAPILSASPPAAAIPNPSFEAGTSTPDSWQVQGDVTLDNSQPLAGKKALLLRRDPATLPATHAVSSAFPLSQGVWEIAGAAQTRIYTPDTSFNVTVSLKCLDKAGKAIKKRRIALLTGSTELTEATQASPWKHFRERIEIPAGTSSAQVEIEFNKTHGEVRVDAFAIEYINASIPMEGGDRKTVFRSNRPGMLFYPGDRPAMEMTLETPTQLTPAQRVTTWQVTDFYGAPLAASQRAPLIPSGTTPAGWHIYRAEIDLASLPLRAGPYAEVRTTTDLGAPSPARDVASFAILPESATAGMDPKESPFGAHTWNATVYDYFPLAARLGIRRCLVFWNFPAEAPFTPAFDSGYARQSRLDWPKRFGLAPYGVLYPVMDVEHKEGAKWTDEAIREGIRQSIQKYKKDGLWGFQIGNEPPSWNPEMVRRDVEVYKVAYEAIKATDPTFVAIGSAIGPNETFFKAGFQPWQDVYNIHGYADLGELRNAMRQYRRLFAQYGGEKPIWSTEIGSMSQGLPRDVIARDIIRKAVSFMADGGAFFTWFAIGGMPDPDGERAGGYSDSMDLFAAKHNMHLPRLDAIAYFHLINLLGARKFFSEKLYEDGTHAFHFRDSQSNSVFVIWHETGSAIHHIPLPGTHEVTLTWMNGDTRRLDARGEGVTLRTSADPLFLSFRGDADLPIHLSAPQDITLSNLPTELVQGASVRIAATSPRKLKLAGPAGWDVAEEPGSASAYRVVIPEDTSANLATFTLSDETVLEKGSTELRFSIPIQSKVSIDLQPVAGEKENASAIHLSFVNRSDASQAVTWNLQILDELPMSGGTYKLTDSRPAQAHFDGAANGKLELKPLEQKTIRLAIGNTDRQTLYRLRATATDSAGATVQRERRVGGFARAVKCSGPPVLDGRLDEAIWRDAPVYNLNEARQFCKVEKDAKDWAGPDDLSGSLRFAWDASHLYVAVQVTDDKYCNNKADSALWSMDGLQFLVDPYRAQERSLGRYDYSMGLGQKGLQAWCHRSAHAASPSGVAPDIRLAVVPAQGGCTYEVAIPWTRLAPFTPATGANLGLTMVVNEDDGGGRKSTIGWFGGVHLKEALYVGDVILSD
ncbi:hypothetical protein DB346_21565 [Verrucomicrobia bacterium LW23]|nr:hypothetical protein DB346_21565 [Verrucomicrobia bacterium LW23]